MGYIVIRLALVTDRLALTHVPLGTSFFEGATSRMELPDDFTGIKLLTSGTSFILRRSRAGKRIISVFSLCSAASPDTGLASTAGLSFAETHGATPGSGRSRPTFANMPAINWLCKCSIFGSAVKKWSIWKESSF